MPWFMLIIGVAIPFSLAAARSRGFSEPALWLRTIRRAAAARRARLVDRQFAGICSLASQRHDPAAVLQIQSSGMDVLQPLGISYLAAHACFLPIALVVRVRLEVAAAAAARRALGAASLLSAGKCPARHTYRIPQRASLWIYLTHWPVFRTGSICCRIRCACRWVGMLSPSFPRRRRCSLGTWIGDYLLFADVPPVFKSRRMIFVGFLGAVLGFLWGASTAAPSTSRWSLVAAVFCSTPVASARSSSRCSTSASTRITVTRSRDSSLSSAPTASPRTGSYDHDQNSGLPERAQRRR